MEYFKRCPTCGSYMNSTVVYACGIPYVDWQCPVCGCHPENVITTDDHIVFEADQTKTN